MITTTKTPTILIVDDHTLFRRGLAMLLEADPRIGNVDDASTGAEGLKRIGSVRPDVVLMDVKMPGMDGIETTRRILSEYPGTKVLVLTSFENDGYVVQALRAGAKGYLLKDSQPEAIVAAILAVHSGERVLNGAVADHVLEMVAGTSAHKERYDGLTRREVEILRLLAEGQANKQIAYQLRISEKTVRNHISNFYAKIGVADRSQAVLYAVRKGLVEA